MKSPLRGPLRTVACWALLSASPLLAQKTVPERKAYPPNIPDANVEPYQILENKTLNVWIFQPPQSNKPQAAIVFFFGGGWVSGSPIQFVTQAQSLSARGMVAILADYRVASRDKVKPADCVADAKTCIRWVRTHAGRLGIDPDRIVAAGGSAGGHLAAATATLPNRDPNANSASVSSVPNALILFNPGVVMAPFDGLSLQGFGAKGDVERFGCEPKEISPLHHVKTGTPPTIIFHGKNDSIVPIATVEKFTEVMKAHGNRCELVDYPGLSHGFFNQSPQREDTLQKADAFLVSLGYLSPP